MTTELSVGFEDMTVLTTEGVEVFTLDMNPLEDVPPLYVDVHGRRFAFSGTTFPVHGHGAPLPDFVREHEAAGHLVLFGERGSRYYGYVHDPAAELEEAAEGEAED